jgi:5,6-dimethylbenzimidazole synthase
MGIDEFLNLARDRRSMRRFKPDPIPDEIIKKILESARWAPSGANSQPWEFIVVKNAETRKKIAEAYIEYWKKIYVLEQMRQEEYRHQLFTAPPTGTPGFVDAPVFIVCCGDPRTYMGTVLIATYYNGEGGPNATYLKNMANPVMIMHLAAASCGLRSTWLSCDSSWNVAVKKILDIPDEIELHTIVPLGYPAYDPPAPYRRKLEDIVHYEKYDHSKARSEQDVLDYIRTIRQMSKSAYGKAKELKNKNIKGGVS